MLNKFCFVPNVDNRHLLSTKFILSQPEEILLAMCSMATANKSLFTNVSAKIKQTNLLLPTGNEKQDIGIPSTFLIHVRGGEDHNTRSVQVELRAASLNSNDVFVLGTRKQSYVWCGKGSTGTAFYSLYHT